MYWWMVEYRRHVGQPYLVFMERLLSAPPLQQPRQGRHFSGHHWSGPDRQLAFVHEQPGRVSRLLRKLSATDGRTWHAEVVSSEVSDSQLIVASSTDPECFGVIFERHFSAVFGFVAASIAVDKADDVASEVFVQAFRQRDRYKPEYASAKPWLFGIAANLVADYYRTQARQNRAYRRVFARDVGDAGFEDEALSRVDVEAVSPLLHKAMGLLRSHERAVVILFVLENMSYTEVAAALEIPVGTVRSRLNRARRRLRNLIEVSGELVRGETSE